MTASQQDNVTNQRFTLNALDRAVVPSHGEVRELAGSRKATEEIARQLIADALASGLVPTAAPLCSGVIGVALPDAIDANLRAVAATAALSVAETSLSLIAQQLPMHRAALASAERERHAAANTAERKAAQLEADIAALAQTIRAPKVEIIERDGRLHVRFPYCEAAIPIISDIPGAKFHGPERDDKKRYWHVAPKYRKRLDAAVPIIDELLAREAARATLLFQAEFTDVPDGVKLRLTWPDLRLQFLFSDARREVMRGLNRQGVSWWTGSDWMVPWSKRDQLKAVLPKLA